MVIVWRFDRFARCVSYLLRALETFKALGIAFVSRSEQRNPTTPTGEMVFTVLGAVAELERSLIVERVRAVLRNARPKGKKLGRPKKVMDAAQIVGLRAQGACPASDRCQLGLGLPPCIARLYTVPKLEKWILERNRRPVSPFGAVGSRLCPRKVQVCCSTARGTIL